jgi:hypothetical protein
MTIKSIGIKEFRKDITSIWKKSRDENIQYIVMHHSKPIFKVTPIQENEEIINNHIHEVEIARKEITTGDVYTEKEVYEILGL